MQPGDGQAGADLPGEAFRLIPPDCAWPSAVLFETSEQIFQRVYHALKPRSPVPRVTVQFEKFANADSFIRLEDSTFHVRITDLLEGAPAPIKESLAFILLCKLLKREIPGAHLHRYRLFLNRRDMRKRAQIIRVARGRKLLLAPRGTFYDLEEVFETLNTRFFHGLMARPNLGWSLRKSRTRLGHFDPSHNTIIISRIFDQRHVVRLAVEYVMFHEMLHLRFPVDHSGARRCVHTKEFKAAEKEFPQLAEAHQLLRTL
jgi:hypothetical protein